MLLALAPPGPPPVVTVSSPRVVLGAGEHGEATILARIAEGFRIQANPASDPFLVPARLEIEADEQVETGAPVYPPGEPYRLEGAAGDLSVYEGEILIRIPLVARRAPGGEAGGERLLRGRLHYQACNARMCLRPSSTPVEVRVTLRPRSTKWSNGSRPVTAPKTVSSTKYGQGSSPTGPDSARTPGSP